MSRETSITPEAAAFTAVVSIAALFIGHRIGRRSAPGQLNNAGTPFANSSKAGARFKSTLPVGKASLQLYSLGTPNGQKVTLLLEELGVSYDAHTINIMKEEQFGSGFVDINPNSKIPALVDYDGPQSKPIYIFESVSIMIYLANKYNSPLWPINPRKRQECMNWLMCQMGSAPYIGQYGHFTRYAPGASKGNFIPYAVDRYEKETKRLCSVLETQLSSNGGQDYLIGDECTLADIAWMPWISCLDWGYNARESLELDKDYPHLMKWVDRIKDRPCAKLGLIINGFGQPQELQEYSKTADRK